MKQVIPLIALIIAPLIGCTTSQQRTTYNSLASIALSVDASMQAYTDLVVRGEVPAEKLREVSKVYNEFQAAYQLALALAQLRPDQPPTPDLITAAAKVSTAIALANGGAK
jgi:hypothetical protein